jgi:starch phosphorylase
VRIEHVEAEAAERGPGQWLGIRASVVLGALSPGDVAVEAVSGRVNESDEIADPAVQALQAESAAGDDGAIRYSGRARLGRPGPFGYTVRVVPAHPLLASEAELGLVTYPEMPAGMTNGDLR